VKEIFAHVNAPIEWEQYDVSGVSAAHESLFKEALESMKRNKVGLKGKHIQMSDRQQLTYACGQAFYSPLWRVQDTYPGMSL